MNKTLTKIVLVVMVLFALFLQAPKPVYAQQNVSCNDSYYQNGNVYKVKVPGTSGQTSLRMTFMFPSGKMRVNIKNGTTNLATLNYSTPKTYVDTRNVPAGATISYELLVVLPDGSTKAPGRWMPDNVPPNRATCGTGCNNQQGGYFAIVPLADVQAKATAGGYSYVDLSKTYTLFKLSERTKNSVDTAVACINDQLTGNVAGTADDDFNDMVMMWTYKAAGSVQSAPTVQTKEPPTAITSTSATLAGKVVSDGGSEITERGFVYATYANVIGTPTIENATKKVVAGKVGDYTANVTGLTANKKYFYRAYATNAKGTTYGETYHFIAAVSQATKPTVVTKSPATSITVSSAKFSGEVTSNGGSAITERGFVYSKSQNDPTLANATKITVSGGVGEYSATASGLSPDTKYYFRAYATNEKGTSYGAVVSFTSGHKPSDTGFEDEPLLYIGGILYAVGVIAFMGARVLGTRRNLRR